MPRLERLEHRVLRESRCCQLEQGRGLAQLQDEQGSDAGISQEVAEIVLFSYFSTTENNAFMTAHKTVSLLMAAECRSGFWMNWKVISQEVDSFPFIFVLLKKCTYDNQQRQL